LRIEDEKPADAERILNPQFSILNPARRQPEEQAPAEDPEEPGEPEEP
jgi:hypothetical protein